MTNLSALANLLCSESQNDMVSSMFKAPPMQRQMLRLLLKDKHNHQYVTSVKDGMFLPLCVCLSVCQQDNYQQDNYKVVNEFSEGWDV